MGKLGNGYGSEFHLMRWMGRHRNAFNRAIGAALNVDSSQINWLDMNLPKSKRTDWSDVELKGLEFIKEEKTLDDWKNFWPQGRGIHNWDAVGWVGNECDRRVVLLEAKAHLGEIFSPCNATADQSLKKIQNAICHTARYLRGDETLEPDDIKVWFEQYYQFANRLAATLFLSNRGYRADLINLFFLGDRRDDSCIVPEKQEEWIEALNRKKEVMGLSGNRKLYDFYSELFLDVRSGQWHVHPSR